MPTLRCDFHVHSCLSPCADLAMSPSAIAAAARAAGLDAVALVDHNSARNAPAFADAARRENIRPLFGLEICTAEEIHVLALFDSPDAALACSSALYPLLPDFPNRPEKFGDQPVVDADENILDFEPRYLGTASSLTYTRAPAFVESFSGLFLPAHVDRPANGVLGRLGHIPPPPPPALEISRHDIPGMTARFGRDYALLSASDAHYLHEIGTVATQIPLPALTIPHLRQALHDRLPSILPPAPR